MKKLLMTAIVACAMLCVSCTTITDRAEKYANDMVNAIQSWDEERTVSLPAEIVEYVNILSNEEKSEFISAFNKVSADAGFDDLYNMVEANYKASLENAQ